MFTVPILTLLLAAPGDNLKLEWKLREGDVFYNKTTATMDQTIEVLGQQMDQTITMKTVVRFKVKSAQEGATVVEMTYLENKIDAQGLPGVNIGDKMKNVTFTATLDSKYKVTKLDGYEKFLDSLTEGDDEQKKLMKLMMPESTIRQMLSQTFAIGPGKPVAVGDTWKQEERVALGPLGGVEMKQTLRLDSVKDDVANISVKGDLTFKPGDGDGGLPFKIVKADLKADKFGGQYAFNLKTGRITETRVEMEMSGTMTIGLAGQNIDAKLVQKMKTVGVITDKNPVVD